MSIKVIGKLHAYLTCHTKCSEIYFQVVSEK